MALLAKKEGLEQFPLFIDYGQISKPREYKACVTNFKRLKLPRPTVMPLAGFGRVISSGLTDSNKRVFEDAFTPGRNLLFLLVGASFAYQKQATAISIGLLNEASSIFPDQTKSFLVSAEQLLSTILDRRIQVLAPLMAFTKTDVVRLAKANGVDQTYSCHAGTEMPCGTCVACREFANVGD
jgi:7-cyano-7-deazaguanine synthase